MSSSTALLPKNQKKDDHVVWSFPQLTPNANHRQPIFLRLCHSPWSFIGQKALVGLRGLTAAYVLFSFFAVIYYDITRNQSGLLTLFKYSSVEYFLQVIYQLLAFVSSCRKSP